jgi:hypothetical protein
MLAGRESLLAELHARLTKKGGDGPRIIALHGMGGVGKTSLAVEYAHRHQATAGTVWQFQAEDTAVLAAEFGRLAALLGTGGGQFDPRDPVASVHAVLAASQTAWLLVFDNAPDQRSLRSFLPPAGNGRVLITSQSALWPLDLALEVPTLERQVAAGFLTARTGDPNYQAAEELADALGGLPLALEQAAAHIHASGGSLAVYLADFRLRRADLLARGEPAGYGKTVAATWTLTFERLERISQLAVGLLRLLACCAPEPVPLPLLLHCHPQLADQFGPDVAPILSPLMADSLVAGDAVAALRRYSLVNFAGDQLVLVHRLVQAVTLDQMPADVTEQWQLAAGALIEAAIPDDTDPPESWPVCAALLPHALALLPSEGSGIARIANYLGESGSYAAARDLQRRVADAREMLRGGEHPGALDARSSVAYWTRLAGDSVAACDLYVALLPQYVDVFGPEHPETLNIRHNIAWAWDAWDPAGARDQYAALLPIAERVFGSEHPETLKSRHNLAYWTGKAGDPARARDLLATLLPVRERVLGPEHPDTLGTRHNLAVWMGKAGDPAGACDLLAALLPVRERVLGPEHPQILKTRHEVARWTGEAGDPAGARDLLAAVLHVEERVLGPEHPDTLITWRNLARWTGEAGDPVGARDLLAHLLLIEERVLGPQHPETVRSRCEAARWGTDAKVTD